MKLNASQQALEWFTKEFQLNHEQCIRLFPRYGGLGEKYNGYSIGISQEKPTDCGKKFEYENKTFYIEQVDLWYFNDCTLNLDVEQEELKICILEN